MNTSSNKLELGEDSMLKPLEQQGRGNVDVVEKVVQEDLPGIVSRSRSPFIQETPSNMLKRMYLIFNGTTSTVPIELDVWKLLFNNANILRSTTFFRYMRAGVRLKFVLTSTPQHYGAILINPLTVMNPDNTPQGIYNWDSYKPILMDYSEQSAVELDIPFISPYEWIDLVLNGGIQPYENLVVLRIRDLFYDALNAAMVKPQLRVYASFIDPELTGAYIGGIESELGFKAQSGNVRYMDPSGIEISIEEPDDFGPGAIVSAGTSASTLATAASALLVVAAPGIYDTATTTFQSAKQLYSNYKMGKSLWSDIKTFASGATNSESSVKQVEGTREPDPLVQSTFGNIATCEYGVSNLLGPHWQRSLYDPMPVGEPRLKHTVLEFAMMPSLFGTREFTPSVTNDYVLHLYPRFFENTYLAQIATLFRLWRGSIRFTFAFYTSPLVSARYEVRVRHNHTVAFVQDTYRKIVPVRGTTILNLEVPYLQATSWLPMNQSSDTWLEIVQLDEPTRVGDKPSSVFIATFVAAGPDFALKFPQSCMPFPGIDPDILEFEAQMNVHHHFATANFESIGIGRPIPTQYDGDVEFIEDILNRFSRRPADVTRMNQIMTYDQSNSDNFDWIIQWFRFWRGSVRFKVGINVATNVLGDKIGAFWLEGDELQTYGSTAAYVGNGMHRINISQNSCVEAEIPFVCLNSFATTTEDVSNSPTKNVKVWQPRWSLSTGATLGSIAVAAGRDFQLALIMPPFRITHYPGKPAVE